MNAVLYIFCEGLTEQAFCYEVLDPHFRAHSNATVCPLVLPNVKGARSRRQKGGWNSYGIARHFLHSVMSEQHRDDVWFTTLFDYYGLPDDYPSLPSATLPPAPRQRVLALEAAMADDLVSDQLWRFTPHLQLHEFETLLLVDIDQFSEEFPERHREVLRLKAELVGLEPEAVNDGAHTHPARRIIRHIPEYESRKVSVGPILASRIGLDRLRSHCPHFANWLAELERRLSGQDRPRIS